MKNVLIVFGLFLGMSLTIVSCGSEDANATEQTDGGNQADSTKCTKDGKCCGDSTKCHKDGKCCKGDSTKCTHEGKCADKCGEGKCADKCGEGHKCEAGKCGTAEGDSAEPAIKCSEGGKCGH